MQNSNVSSLGSSFCHFGHFFDFRRESGEKWREKHKIANEKTLKALYGSNEKSLLTSFSLAVDKYARKVKGMNSEKEYSWVLKQYPAAIKKEQFYKICRISKRTALVLLETGLVP